MSAFCIIYRTGAICRMRMALSINVVVDFVFTYTVDETSPEDTDYEILSQVVYRRCLKDPPYFQ